MTAQDEYICGMWAAAVAAKKMKQQHRRQKQNIQLAIQHQSNEKSCAYEKYLFV